MGRLIDEVRERSLKRPWLLVAPLLGVLGQTALTLLPSGIPAALATRMVLTALLTAVVTTLFAELWLGDGRSVVPGRFVGTGILFLLPYPLLIVFGATTAPFVYWVLRADIPRPVSLGALYLVLAVGKLVAFGAGAASALAAARRSECPGPLRALRLGGRMVWANLGFFLVLLGCFWALQEASVYLARTLAPGPLADFFTTLIPLFGCVAFPVEAWRAGRLKDQTAA